MMARVAWIGAALLVATACNATESRWVLWGYTIAGGWVPINEHRSLDECNRFLGLVLPQPHRCMPFGAVPIDPPPPRR
jgi:hypothetical protein